MERSTGCDESHGREGGDSGLRDAGTARRIDRLYEQMCDGLTYESMDALVAHLHAQRAFLPADAWSDYVANVLLRHPLRDFLHRDPFTSRAYAKPRGYAGDAVLTDMAYFPRHGPALVDAIGEAVFHYTIEGTLARALRNRCQRLAMLIDETVREHPAARLLALDAGHLREIELTRTFGEGFAGEIVAVDQDSANLAVIEYDYSACGVRTLHIPLERLLAGEHCLCGFDLVYAAGLSDRLPLAQARTLAECMFAMLNPGGRMLIANFAPDLADAAYLESFMDWRPVYRNERDMFDLLAGIAHSDITEADLSFDAMRSVVYLLVRRRNATEPTFRRERLRESRAAFRNEWLRKTTRQA